MITTRSSNRAVGWTLVAGLAGAGCGDNFAAPAPPPDAKAPDAGFSASTAIALASPDGSFYTAMVNVGTQVFAMDVDTGSTTVGVAEMSCTTCTGVTPLYAPGATAVDDHATTKAEYGDGSSWTGEIYVDELGLQYGTPDVKVQLAAIDTQSGFFDGSADSYQGILGLGPSDLLLTGTSAYLTAAKAAGAPTKMAFELCPTSGKMWLGDFDATAASAPPQFTPMIPLRSNGFYAVEVDDMALGGTTLGFGASTFQDPIVDTGTSLFYVPTTVLTALETALNTAPGTTMLFGTAALGGSNGHRCLTAAGVTPDMVDAMMPPLSLSFPDGNGGTFSIDIPPSQYLQSVGNGRFCLAIEGAGQGGSILGDTFLQSFVTVIDAPNNQIGFAPDAGCASATTSASRVRAMPHEHGRPRFHPRT